MLNIEHNLSGRQKDKIRGLMDSRDCQNNLLEKFRFSDYVGYDKMKDGVVVYEIDKQTMNARISSFDYGTGVQKKSVCVRCNHIIDFDVMYSDLKQLGKRFEF